MKTSIKITILCLVVAIVGVVIALSVSTGGTDKQVKTVVASTDYEKSITENVDQTIPTPDTDKSFDEVQKAYQDIMDQIATDKGLGKAKESELKNAQRIATDRYAAWLNARAEKYFNLHNWNGAEVSAISTGSKALLNSGLIDNPSPVASSLNKWVQTAADYQAARSFVASCGGYAGVDAARSKIAKANSYKKGLLTNNTALMASLNGVRDKLYQAHVAHTRSVISPATDASRYSSYDAYLNAYANAQSELSNFRSNAGVYGRSSGSVNSDLASSISAINSAKSWADRNLE